MAGGQAIDLEAVRQALERSRSSSACIAQKTGALIQASVLLGAISAGLPDAPQRAALDRIRRGDRPRLPDPGRHPRRRRHHRRARQTRRRGRRPRQADLSVGARPGGGARAGARAPRSRALPRSRRWGARFAALERIREFPRGARQLNVGRCSAAPRVNFAGNADAPDPFALLRAINSPGRPARAAGKRSCAAVCDELRDYLLETRRHDAAATSPPASARSSSRSRCTTSSTRRDDRLVWDVGHQTYPHKILTGRRDRLRHASSRTAGSRRFPRATKASTTPSASATRAPRSPPRSAWRSPPSATKDDAQGRRGHRRRRDDRRHGLRGAEQCRRARRRPAGDPERQRHVDLARPVGALNRLPRAAVSSGKFYARCARRRQEGAASRCPPLCELARALRGACEGHGACRARCSRSSASTTSARSTATTSTALVADAAEHAQTLKGPQFLHVVTQQGQGLRARPRPTRSATTARASSIPASGIVKPARRRRSRPTRRSSATGCATWRQHDAAPGRHHAGDARRLGPGRVLRSASRTATSTSASPSSTRSPSPPAWPAKALKPVVAIYSTFLQRGYDQLIHDVALQNLPVVFALDRAGLVGADGATHAGRLRPHLPALHSEHGGDGAGRRERMPADAATPRRTLDRPGGGALSARPGAGRAPVERTMTALPIGKARDAPRGPQRPR